MGQKTHPKGFRLTTTQSHLSSWYSKKSLYSKISNKDHLLRTEISSFLNRYLTISDIFIERILSEKKNANYLKINIYGLLPTAKDLYKLILQENVNFSELTKTALVKNTSILSQQAETIISHFLEKKILYLNRILRIKYKDIVFIKLNLTKTIFNSSLLIAKYIGGQLEKRVPFRRVLNQTLKQAESNQIKGIKIEISGRLNGNEIARSEWKRVGSIPLHTLTANIDYAIYPIFTKDGVIGIKVWLLK